MFTEFTLRNTPQSLSWKVTSVCVPHICLDWSRELFFYGFCFLASLFAVVVVRVLGLVIGFEPIALPYLSSARNN